MPGIVILAIIACLATLLILVIGVVGFGIGKSPSFSNRMMRYRIIAQFVAVVLIMVVVLLAQTGK